MKLREEAKELKKESTKLTGRSRSLNARRAPGGERVGLEYSGLLAGAKKKKDSRERGRYRRPEASRPLVGRGKAEKKSTTSNSLTGIQGPRKRRYRGRT